MHTISPEKPLDATKLKEESIAKLQIENRQNRRHRFGIRRTTHSIVVAEEGFRVYGIRHR